MQVTAASEFCSCLFCTKCLSTLFGLVQRSCGANSVRIGSCSHLLSEWVSCIPGQPEHNTPIVLPRLRIQGKKRSLHTELKRGQYVAVKPLLLHYFFSQTDRCQRRAKPKTPHTPYKRTSIIVADVCCRLPYDNSKDFDLHQQLPLSECFFDLQSLRNKAVTVD